MATEKEVEKAQERVAKKRLALAEAQASVATSTEAQNEVYLDQLAREEAALDGEIAEIKATRERQHPDAANPLAFAQATLVRDEIVVDQTDTRTKTQTAASTGKEN